MGEVVHAKEDGGPVDALGVEFGPEGLEDGPGALGFFGGVDQGQEGLVDGDVLGELVVVGDGEQLGEDLLVGLFDGLEELEAVVLLHVEGWVFGVGDGGVFG